MEAASLKALSGAMSMNDRSRKNLE
jgi:hypothetical protein